jgi:hypothetical protein
LHIIIEKMMASLSCAKRNKEKGGITGLELY